MLKEFKAFIMRGNVVDLAVGIIIGIAFTQVVNSLVKDVIMPPIGMLLGGLDFSNLFISLNGQHYANLAAAQAAGAPTINYGVFITNVISFLIVAIVVFLIVKALQHLMPPPPPPADTTRDCPYCQTKVSKKATRCPACTSQLEAVKG